MKHLIKFNYYLNEDHFDSGFVDTSNIHGCYVIVDSEEQIAQIIAAMQSGKLILFTKQFDAYDSTEDMLNKMNTVMDIITLYCSETYNYPKTLVLDEDTVNHIIESSDLYSSDTYKKLFGGE